MPPLTITAWCLSLLAVAAAADQVDHRFFLHEIFSKYGAQGAMTFEGFEHLLANLGLGRLKFDKNHSVAVHRVNGTFRDVHDSLKLHNHSHPRNKRYTLSEYEPELKKLMLEHNENTTSSGATPRVCLTPHDILVMYGVQPHHGAVISPLTFLHMCPVIIYELDQKACYTTVVEDSTGHVAEQLPTGSWKWLYAAGSVLVISVTGLAGMLLVPLVHTAFYQHVINFLVALAVGTLCGDALLHLLPHAIMSGSEDHVLAVLQGATAFGAACVLYTIEAIVYIRGQDESAEKNCSDGDRKSQEGLQDSAERVQMVQRKGSREDSEKSVHAHRHEGGVGLSSLVHMVVMGDGLHNLTDGLAIGAAFSGDLVAGVATTVAVFCHELPHELGDFAVLIKSGVSIKRAVVFNVCSSILSFVGMACGLWLGDFRSANNWISSFTAGSFLYIALANLVPEMKSTSGNMPHLVGFVLQVSGIATGGMIMLVIALFEDSILTMFG